MHWLTTAQVGTEMLSHPLSWARLILSLAGKSSQWELQSTRTLGCRPKPIFTQLHMQCFKKEDQRTITASSGGKWGSNHHSFMCYSRMLLSKQQLCSICHCVLCCHRIFAVETTMVCFFPLWMRLDCPVIFLYRELQCPSNQFTFSPG